MILRKAQTFFKGALYLFSSFTWDQKAVSLKRSSTFGLKVVLSFTGKQATHTKKVLFSQKIIETKYKRFPNNTNSWFLRYRVIRGIVLSGD